MVRYEHVVSPFQTMIFSHIYYQTSKETQPNYHFPFPTIGEQKIGSPGTTWSLDRRLPHACCQGDLRILHIVPGSGTLLPLGPGSREGGARPGPTYQKVGGFPCTKDRSIWQRACAMTGLTRDVIGWLTRSRTTQNPCGIVHTGHVG
jgi:hypothetical protein